MRHGYDTRALILVVTMNVAVVTEWPRLSTLCIAWCFPIIARGIIRTILAHLGLVVEAAMAEISLDVWINS